MAQVSLKNLVKRYTPASVAVDSINLGIENKEFCVLVGPSGCGKSTTLRMIAGLDAPTSGEIFISDRLVNEVPAKDRNIAMVFQNYALYPHMNVYENMAFALKLRGYSQYDIERRVTDAARILGIKHLIRRKPRQLSGGERQRVAVGRAIVRKPMVFLFDEPLSNLDAKMRVQMRTEIHKLHLKIKTTMIYVTHDQVEAMTLGDRIAVMKDGKIQQCDTPSTVYEKPANKFVGGFIGSPPMNFMKGKLTAKEGGIYFDEGHFQLKTMKRMNQFLDAYIGKNVYLGVRAEDIYDKLFASDAASSNTIRTTCEVVEIMGSHNFLYLTAGKHTVIASVEGDNKPVSGTPLEVVFDMDRVHFFDLSTEKTIV